MRWAMLVVFAAVSTAAHAEAPRCFQGLLHPTTCKSAPKPAPAPSTPASGAPAAAQPAPSAPSTPTVQPAPSEPPAMQPAVAASPPARAPAPAPAQHAAGPAAAPRPAPPAPAAVDPRFVTPYACNFAQKVALGAAVCQARQAAEAHQKVGILFHEGRCDEAVKAALATGDEAFAGRVRDYCVARQH